MTRRVLSEGATELVQRYRRAAAERRTANVKLEERKEEGDERREDRFPSDPRTPRRTPEKPNETPGGVVPKDGRRVKSGLGLNVRTLTPEFAKNLGLEGCHVRC